MPRYIFSPPAVPSTGQPQHVQIWDRAVAGRRLFDCYSVDGSDNTALAITNGVIVSDAAGNLPTFAGPEDTATLYIHVYQAANRILTPSVRVTNALTESGQGMSAGQPGPSTIATTRLRGYNPATQIYNLKPYHLQKFRAGLGRATAATGICDVGVIGDSIAGGFGNTNRSTDPWPIRGGAAIAARTGVTQTGGWVAPYYSGGVLDSRWVIGSGFVQTFQYPPVGSSTSTNGGNETYTSVTAGTVCEVLYYQASGPFTVQVDALTAVAVTPTGGTTFGVYTVTGMTNTTHAVKVTTTSSTATYIMAMRVRQATGLSVSSYGYVGTTTTDWNQTGVSFTYQTIYAAQTTSKDLALIQLGTNDANLGLIPVATYKANLLAMVAFYQATSDVVLVTPPPANGIDLTLYRSAMYDVADALDVPLIDQFDRMGSYARANALGEMFDSLHPNSVGAADLGLTLQSLVP